MLGPALGRLFLAINEVEAGQRNDFEKELHRELMEVSQSLDHLELTGGVKSSGVTPELATAAGDLKKSLTVLGFSTGLGTGNVPTNVNTKCSKTDCPNKRIK